MCNSVGCINSSDTTAKTLLSGKSLTLQGFDLSEHNRTSKDVLKELSLQLFKLFLFYSKLFDMVEYIVVR